MSSSLKRGLPRYFWTAALSIGNFSPFFCLEDDYLGELAVDLVEVLLEIAHAGLAGVALGDEEEGVPRVAHRAALEAGLVEALRDEVVLGDLELLRIDVAGQLDDLHAIDEGRGDRVQGVGRADEEDIGQVEGQVEVVVAEAEVLLGIEGLEQRARGIALV